MNKVAATPAASAIQHSFDAEVEIATAEIGLYLVVGRSDGPRMHRALASVGAAIAARISATRVLAVMHFRAFETIRSHRDIGLVGPVSLDPTRFEIFQKVIGLQVDPD